MEARLNANDRPFCISALCGVFWRIPRCNAEVSGIRPWREAVLNGLRGSSIGGFHTRLHCNTFIEAAGLFIESHIDREDSTISVGGHRGLVRPYPISAAWPAEGMEALAPVAEYRRRIFARDKAPPQTDLPAESTMAVAAAGVRRRA